MDDGRFFIKTTTTVMASPKPFFHNIKKGESHFEGIQDLEFRI